MRKHFHQLFLVLLVALSFAHAATAQVPIFTQEKIYQIQPDSFLTYHCNLKTKYLWADSSAGYTSYLWSTGATTPKIAIPTLPQGQAAPSYTLTVGLPGGGTATSVVTCSTSTLVHAHGFVFPMDYVVCPGQVEFRVEDHHFDSIIVFANGASIVPDPLTICNIVTQPVLSTTPHTDFSATRYSTNGCVTAMPIETGFRPFRQHIAPTVTVNGNAYTAFHPSISPFSTMQVYEWYDLSGSLLYTGQTFTPTTATSFYVMFKNRNSVGHGISVGHCVGGGSFTSCYSVSSDTLQYPSVGTQDGTWKNYAVFPNPTTGKFRLTQAPNSPILLLDAQGRDLATLPATQEEFDLSTFPAGLYWLRFQNAEGNWDALPVLKQQE